MKSRYHLLSFLFIIGFTVYGQNTNILLSDNEYQLLIGMTYSEASELGNFAMLGRAGMIKDGHETQSTHLLSDSNHQIITSEVLKIDRKTNGRLNLIQDIIVLKGRYRSCGGCLIPKTKGVEIMTIHGPNSVSEKTILLVFERNLKSGKYTQADPSQYAWNTKADRL